MERIVSMDPRTGEPAGEVPATPVEEVGVVMDRSRKAFAHWSTLPIKDRQALLRRFKRVVLDRGVEIAEIVRSETGKPIEDAYSTDVMPAMVVMDHYLRNGARYLKDRRASSWPFITTRSWTEYHPRGVAAVISPWNYPFFLPMIATFTALSAGCSVVLKPSEVTPLSGQLFVDLSADAGLPSDLIQVVHGTGDVGSALIDAGPDIIAFTGSTAVGKKVAEQAARDLIPVVLELGGNDAMVVLDDADITEAAKGAIWGGMVNAGQACVSVERIYAVDAIYDGFVAELTGRFDSVTAATGDRREIGPIIHPPQVGIIERHVADAVSRGARVVRGGNRVDGAAAVYFEPTLLVDVDHSMAIMNEETFGPVLPVMRVPDDATAVALANDSRFGLHGSVWTTNRKRGAETASAIRSGTVAVNDVIVNFITPSMPFGGIGDSGSGTNFGPDGIRAYCYHRSITSTRLPWSTLGLLGARFPRRRGMRYWRTLARLLFRW